ncbi:coiled-coil domain-containing protein 102a [Plakobranchus ocellatus]|uniref:Coiled-coil domain-containing protein 102a n=1 Tax=Plakobranchus ocellatus TaxID=259542 RepID=A0AAV4AHD7_9GAST|nr:coiled-coil domain-containing protein 102a [Plakobranchus ocellatus]
MSKSSNSALVGAGVGNSRGDVSFIRAVQGSSGSNLPPSSEGTETFSGLGTSQSSGGSQVTSHPRIPPHDISLQPHLYYPKQQQHHQLQQSLQPQHHSPHPQHFHSSSTQQYLPEHMEAQQYHFKHPHHGAGGASGDPGIRGGPSHTDGWSDREEALAAELEEAKIRVAQMEKTMRWWSDCTSNWREKWNKARGERNKAKDENRILRAKLEALAKEVTRLRRERKEALALEKETASPSSEGLSGPQPAPAPEPSSALSENDQTADEESKESQAELSEKEKTVIAGTSEKESESLDDLSEASSSVANLMPNNEDEKNAEEKESLSSISHTKSERSDLEFEWAQKVSELQEELSQVKMKAALASENAVMMQRKLDEANNTIQSERLEKCSHLRTVEQLQAEVKSLQSNLETEKQAKQDLKMLLDKAKTAHEDEMSRLNLDLEDEASSRSTMDKQVSDLRRDLERIQAENANEWAKRERLESEKLSLERDNKKLRAQVSDLEEELQRRSQAVSSLADSDIKTLQFELAENQKELSDMRHSQGKLRKVLGERGTELEHTRRRAEQYQEEVRKLRGRVEELKHDLAAAEDEKSSSANSHLILKRKHPLGVNLAVLLSGWWKPPFF